MEFLLYSITVADILMPTRCDSKYEIKENLFHTPHSQQFSLSGYFHISWKKIYIYDKIHTYQMG